MMSVKDMRKEEVLELRAAGYNLTEIAKYYHTCTEKTRKAIIDMGIDTSQQSKGTEITKEQFQAWIDGGKSVRQIADENQMSWNTARKLADKLGVDIRAKTITKTQEAMKLKTQGLSHEAIAKKLGMSLGFVSKVLAGFDRASDAMMVQDQGVRVDIDRHPEAPDLSRYCNHWSAHLANAVLQQALRDLWSGSMVHQQSAADFFRTGHHTMWAWLTGYRDDEVYDMAVKVSKRQVTLPGDARPKNFGIVLD